MHSGLKWHTANSPLNPKCFKVKHFDVLNGQTHRVYPRFALADLLHVLKKETLFKQERTCVKIMKASDLRMVL